jgi:DNA-binding NarL/FixJ family response regulator
MTTATTVLRVLVADDHPIVRKGLVEIINLQEDMRVVAEAVNGKEAIDLFRQRRPDVTLMDLRMPEMGGADAIAAIRAIQPDACVLVLTTYDGEEDVFRVLQAGARGYLLKDAPLDELVKTIRTAHDSPGALPAAVAGKLVGRMQRPPLTDRETEVLREMTLGKSNKQIASALEISESTVKVHVNNVLRKLNVGSRTEAVTQALKLAIVHLE